MLNWALDWAAQGTPVFPLHEVYGDICTCTCTRKKCGNGKHGCGSECGNKGKHPRTMHGKDDATTDPAQIKAWWGKWPNANIGGRMGGALRLLAVDVDPKTGGDASLCDLTEAHGSEWLDTRVHETGSLGSHLFFTLPEGLEVPNTAGKIAPGIDTRAGDGYVILPPSLHASGRRYRITEPKPERAAPEWMLEDLMRKPTERSAHVIDFQEKRTRRSSGDSIISEGERNEGLFRVGCAIWGSGNAQDLPDLHAQLLEVNVERCSPPLLDSEVAQIVGSIARYPCGVPIQQEATA
jgi:hypothetical protein